MASGDILAEPVPFLPLGANAAEMGGVTGGGGTGSEPAEHVDTFDFDPGSTEEHAYFYGRMSERYGATGIDIKGYFSSDATSGNVKWAAAIRRLDTGHTLTGATHAYSFQTATVATAGTASRPALIDIAMTDGTQMDDLAAGEAFILCLKRNSSDAADTMNSNDAKLWYQTVQIVEP